MLPNVIAITGASSGIGAALARRYAAADRTLALLGRDVGRLETVARDCRRKGATIECGVVDVRDAAAIFQWLLRFDAAHPIDLLIANAGILAGSLEPGTIESLELSSAQIATNFIGALNTAVPVLSPMLQRGRGQIAFVASLAAFAAHPEWPGYCASKAALLVYGLSLRERLRGSGISVSVVCPGWVTAPINDPYEMWRPFEMSPEAAAKQIIRGLERERAVIAFPRCLALSARLLPLLPQSFIRLANAPFRAKHRRT
jgi:short-subunit dehydrogenase